VKADVFVFCVQTARSHSDYNPLDVGQWEFYVAPGTEIMRDSLSLATISRRWPKIGFEELAKAIG
jgi:hypothetical protein